MERKRLDSKIVILGHSGVGKTSMVAQYVNNEFSANTSATIGAAFMKKDVMINVADIPRPSMKANTNDSSNSNTNGNRSTINNFNSHKTNIRHGKRSSTPYPPSSSSSSSSSSSLSSSSSSSLSATSKEQTNSSEFCISLQIWDTAGQERFRSMAPMYYRGAHAAILVFDITKPMTLHNAMSWVDELRLHGNDDTIIVFAANKSDLKGGSNQASAVACPTLQWARDHVARILPHAEVVETSAKTGQGIAMLFHTVATRLYQEEERREEERHREREAREKERGRGRGGREEKKSVRVGEENAGQHNSLDANGCC